MRKFFGKKAVLAAAAAVMMFGSTNMSALAEEAQPQEGDTYELSIIHNNDVHGRMEWLPQFKTLIDEAREETDNLLVLNGGDIFLRGPLQDQQGIPEMTVLNEMGYDAWVPGNNDFRVPPKEEIQRREMSRFRI